MVCRGLGRASGTYSFPATERRHQLLITGNAGDSLAVSGATWTNAGTVIFNGSFSGSLNGTFNVWNSAAGLGQLLVNTSLATSGLA